MNTNEYLSSQFVFHIVHLNHSLLLSLNEPLLSSELRNTLRRNE